MRGTLLLLSILALLATAPARAESSQNAVDHTGDRAVSQEMPVILEMAAENIDLGRGPKGWQESVKPPALESTREGVFAIIGEESLQGPVAFDFLRTVLLAGADGPAEFRARALAILDSLGLTPDQRQAILELLDGQKSAIHVLAQVPKRAFPERASNNDGPGEVFAEIQSMLQGLPSFFPGKQKLIGAVDLAHDLIIPADEDCYENNPLCDWGSNQGIVEHESNLLSGNEEFLLDSLRFYARLFVYDSQHPHQGDFSVFDVNPGADVWKMALSSVSGDARRALRVLEVSGHDDCCNAVSYKGQSIPELQGVFNLLNEISPSAYHSDMPVSLLQAPGSLAGVTISASLQKKFRKLLTHYDALQIPRPALLAGYHHVFGGLLTADELIRGGYGKVDGLKLAVFLSEGLGYFYKKFTFPLWLGDDGKALWEQIGHDERKRPKRPHGWDVARFAAAKLDLETGLLSLQLSREEHKAGANFAFHTLLKARSPGTP